MTVSLRPATLSDLDGVVAVFLACWRESYRGLLPAETVDGMTDERAEALWQRVIPDPRGDTVVAVEGDEILGITRYAPATGEVHSLYVSPRAQGRGIGALLLAAACEALRAAGSAEARLWVFAGNAPSRAFYERQGWIPTGEERTQAEFGAPELRLRRELS